MIYNSISFKYLLLLLCLMQSFTDAATHRKVKLKDVESIVLQEGRFTTGRRTSPIPQLQCVKGPCEHKPSSVICYNSGSDGIDAVWKCNANLPDGISFGSLNVACEGFDYPEDPYILHNSCGLEYTLKGSAHNQYDNDDYEPNRQAKYQTPKYQRGRAYNMDQQEGGLSSIVTYLLYIGVGYVLIKALFTCCCGGSSDSSRDNDNHRRGNDGDIPPRPQNHYDPRNNSSYSNNSSNEDEQPGASQYKNASQSQYQSSSSSSSSSMGSNFTAAALGAAAGYMLGSNNRQSSSSGWYNSSSSRPSAWSTPSFRSSSSSRSSSGFGTTSRR